MLECYRHSFVRKWIVKNEEFMIKISAFLMILLDRKFTESFRYGWNQELCPSLQYKILYPESTELFFFFSFNTSPCFWQETADPRFLKVYVFSSVGYQAELTKTSWCFEELKNVGDL